MSRSRSSLASNAVHDRLEPRLQKAVGNNDLDALARIISLSHENGQFSENFLRIGLMRSAERGRIEATHYLLRLGAKADIPNTGTATAENTGNRPSPLLRAVERNHVRIVQLLLDYGATPETMDKKGRTALMTAAWKNHWQCAGSADCARGGRQREGPQEAECPAQPGRGQAVRVGG